MLPAEGRVVLSHLRLDNGVARLGSYGLPALALDVHRSVLEREGLENGWDLLACNAISRVDHDLQPPQALRLYKAQAMFRIVYGDVGLLHGTRVFRGFGEIPGDDEVADLA